MAKLWYLTAYFTCLLLISTALASKKREHLAEYYSNLSSRSTYEWPQEKRELYCGEHINRIGTRSSKGKNRVLGGQQVYPGQFPHAVRLELTGYEGKKKICGGTIITFRWIVTAASCFYEGDDGERWTTWEVVVGDYSLQQSFDGGRKVPIQQIMLHPGYKPFQNDIALMQTRYYLNFNLKKDKGGYGAVNRACLPTTDYMEDEEVEWLVGGWGRTENDEQPDSMSYYKPRAIDYSLCTTADFDDRAEFDPDSNICTFNEDGKTTVFNDTGNGIVRRMYDGRYELLGIVSYGHPTRPESEPVVSTNLYYHIEWIKEIVREEEEKELYDNCPIRCDY